MERPASAAQRARGVEADPLRRYAWRGLPWRERLRVGMQGVGILMAGIRRRGWWGPIAAVVAAPLAVAYVLGALVRDATSRREREAPSADRQAYLRRRYGGRSQHFVNRREHGLVATLLARVGGVDSVLDVPTGYGRFAPMLDETGGMLVCADVDLPRLRALRASGVAGRRPRLVLADLQGALPFRTACADLVFNMRYLHHAHGARQQEVALAELVRVSRRWVIVSYYRDGNCHALVRRLQRLTRGSRRRDPAMIARRDFDRMVRDVGCRRVCDLGVLPWFHAQRLVLLERCDVIPSIRLEVPARGGRRPPTVRRRLDPHVRLHPAVSRPVRPPA